MQSPERLNNTLHRIQKRTFLQRMHSLKATQGLGKSRLARQTI